MRELKLEFYKIRRKNIVPMLLFLLAAEMMWAFLSNRMSVSRNPDQAVWESILLSSATRRSRCAWGCSAASRG
ncbi:MAG: hypothetical protein A9Z00_14380 [Thermobacillus sp. ZCTH02-B1]|nr:MAG: hypothetical protein A9Z00_14380 [Thermobacillus sp. ZCTH02-B1]